MKRFAFTLAELLIALTIVGVVAVLTVPAVTKNVFQKSNIVKLEATIKTLNDAVNKLMIDERATSIEDSSLAYQTGDPEVLFTKYLKATKVCDNDIYECFATEYKTINGSDYEPLSVTFEGDDALLPSGAAVQYRPSWPAFFIDVNGPEPPNVFGRDFFTVLLNDDGTLASSYGFMLSDPTVPEDRGDLVASCHSSLNYGANCLYILEQDGWVMDY